MSAYRDRAPIHRITRKIVTTSARIPYGAALRAPDMPIGFRFFEDLAVWYSTSDIYFTPVGTDPDRGQYACDGEIGLYHFSSLDAGRVVKISYTAQLMRGMGI